MASSKRRTRNESTVPEIKMTREVGSLRSVGRSYRQSWEKSWLKAFWPLSGETE